MFCLLLGHFSVDPLMFHWLALNTRSIESFYPGRHVRGVSLYATRHSRSEISAQHRGWAFPLCNCSRSMTEMCIQSVRVSYLSYQKNLQACAIPSSSGSVTCVPELLLCRHLPLHSVPQGVKLTSRNLCLWWAELKVMNLKSTFHALHNMLD